MILMTDYAFGGSVKLEFELDGQRKEIEARLEDVEHIFHIGDEICIIAGVYSGLEGYIIQRNNNVFTVC
jgi:hypothetical protein